jgi:hypothetical protein
MKYKLNTRNGGPSQNVTLWSRDLTVCESGLPYSQSLRRVCDRDVTIRVPLEITSRSEVCTHIAHLPF